MGFVACTDDTKYTPVTPDATEGVYFPQQETDILLMENQDKVTVAVYRYETADALTVPLISQLPAGFTAPENISFAPGEEATEFDVTFNFADIVPNTKYSLDFMIPSEYANALVASQLSLTVQYSPWTDWERLTKDEYGIYTYNNVFASGDEEAAVYERHSLIDPNIFQYRVGDYEDANVPENQQSALTLLGYMPYNLVIEYNRTNGTVKVPCVSCVTTYGDQGAIHAGCAYSYGTDVNPSFIAGIDPLQVLKMSSFNEKTGMFSLMMVYYTAVQPFGNKMEYLQLPGYVNETVKVELNGKYVTEAGQEMQVFNIFMSEGVSAVKYRIYNGSMTEAKAEAQAQGIAGDPNVEEVTASGNLAVAMEEGKYTIVIAGVDKNGNYLTFDYLTFDYVSVAADPNEGWTSLGEVLYGDDYFTVFGSEEAPLQVNNYYVEAQQSDDDPTVYRLVDPYGKRWPYYGLFDNIEYISPTGYLLFQIIDEDAMVVNTELNMTVSGEQIYLGSRAYNNIARAINGGTSFDDALAEEKAAGNVGTFIDQKMTMPAKSLIIWLGTDRSATANQNGGFQINFAPDEEEEEEAVAYSARSLKTFTAKVQQFAVSRVADACVRNTPKAIVLDNKTWFKYKGNKQSVNKISL